MRSGRSSRRRSSSRSGSAAVCCSRVPCLVIAGVLLVLTPFLRTFEPERGARRHGEGENRPGALVLLLGVIGFRSLAWFGLITFVPLWEVSLGHSPAHGNHLLSLMLLAGGIGTIVAGPLADRIGRRPVLIASLALVGAADLRLRRGRRHRGRVRALRRRHLRDRDVRRDDGDVAGVPAAADRHGVGPFDRPLDRARRDRRRRRSARSPTPSTCRPRSTSAQPRRSPGSR